MVLWNCENCGSDNDFEEGADLSKVKCEVCGQKPSEELIKRAQIESRRRALQLEISSSKDKLLDITKNNQYYEEELRKVQELIKKACKSLDKANSSKDITKIVQNVTMHILEIPTKEDVDKEKEIKRKRDQEETNRRWAEKQRLKKRKHRQHIAAAILTILLVSAVVGINAVAYIEAGDYLEDAMTGDKDGINTLLDKSILSKLPGGDYLFTTYIKAQVKSIPNSYNKEKITYEDAIQSYDLITIDEVKQELEFYRQDIESLHESKLNYQQGKEAQEKGDYVSAMSYYQNVISMDFNRSDAFSREMDCADLYREGVKQQISDFCLAGDINSAIQTCINGLDVLSNDSEFLEIKEKLENGGTYDIATDYDESTNPDIEDSEIIELNEETDNDTEMQLTTKEPSDLSSYKKLPVIAADASSVIQQQGIDNGPMKLFDGDYATTWQEGVKGYGAGEYVAYSFDSTYKVKYVGFVLGNWKDDNYYYGNGRPRTLTILLGDKSEQVTFFDEKVVQWIVFPDGVNADSMRIIIDDVYPGTSWEDTCISEIMVYGE